MCTSPPKVENGFVSYDSLAVGSSWSANDDIIYKCFKFYGLVDSDRLTCNGAAWTGTIPKCEYHVQTEGVFWTVLVLLLLVLLAVLAILLFLCCYFCRCCKRNGRRDNVNVSRMGDSHGSTHDVHRQEINRRSHGGDHEHENSDCCACCYGTSEKNPQHGNRKRSNSPKQGKSQSPDRRSYHERSSTGCCTGCCEHKRNNSDPKRKSDGVNENNNETNPGCCACCYGKSKQRKHNNSYPEGHVDVQSKGKKRYDQEPNFKQQPTKSAEATYAKETKTNQAVVDTRPIIYSSYQGRFYTDDELIDEEMERQAKEEQKREKEDELNSQKENERQKSLDDERQTHLDRLRNEQKEKEEEEKQRIDTQKRDREDEQRRRDAEKRRRQKEFELEKQNKIERLEKERKENEERRLREKEETDRMKQQENVKDEELKRLKEEEGRRQRELETEHQEEVERLQIQEKEKEERHRKEIEEEIQRNEREEEIKRHNEEERRHNKDLEEERKRQEEFNKERRRRKAETIRQKELEHERQKEKERLQREQMEREERHRKELEAERQRTAQQEKKMDEELLGLKDEERLRQELEDEKKKEAEHLKKSQRARIEEPGTPHQSPDRTKPENKKFEHSAFVAVRNNNYRGNRISNPDTKHTSPERDTSYHHRKKQKPHEKVELMNSNDKYVKGLLNENIGKRGIQNPKVYKSAEQGSLSARENDSRITNASSDNPKHQGADHDKVQKKPVKLVNSNDKFVKGITSDLIGERGTKNPFVYRPYKIERPTFTE